MGAAVLEAHDLSKTYAMGEIEVVALRGVDLELHRGELVVMLGPSGSGKSTLLNILGGLDRPTRGTFHYLQRELTQADDRSLTQYRPEHVGFVFQFYALATTWRRARASHSGDMAEAACGALATFLLTVPAEARRMIARTDSRPHDRLVDFLVLRGALRDPRVIRSMRQANRQWFVTDANDELAAVDRPLSIGYAQTISQPTVVAEMTEALALRGDERVLEIGTGSGWQAAVLSPLAAEVYSIERIPELGRRAAAALAAHRYTNVHVRIGDGYLGWPELAPFDRIVLTAAPEQLPRALVDQLAEGGLLVAPVGDYEQRLLCMRKVQGALETKELFPVVFVPMLPGVAPARDSRA